MTTFTEPSRAVPVVETTDVLVAGAGPAGALAAIAAARLGARVRLIEAYGAIGGIWTTGCLPHIIEPRKDGLLRELLARLQAAGAGPGPENPNDNRTQDYDVETMKVVLEQMALEAGVAVRLYTRVSAAYRDADGRLTTIVTDSKSGREAWQAKVFIDCTGDGDLSAQAGCAFDIGDPETGQCQPMSMMALLSGAGRSDQLPFTLREWSRYTQWTLEALRRLGHDPSYGRPSLFLLRDHYIIMMANHQYGYRGPDAQMLTDATIAGRAENLAIVNTLRKLGDGWERLELMAQSGQIGVRESRRIHGLYRITRDDLINGSEFDDAVCRVGYCVDIHALNPSRGTGIEPTKIKVKPYCIPLRALMSRDVPNLMMAGRCISGDFTAHSSYRVTGDAAKLGEAAGTAAAVAVQAGTDPRDVPFDAIRPHLPPLEGIMVNDWQGRHTDA